MELAGEDAWLEFRWEELKNCFMEIRRCAARFPLRSTGCLPAELNRENLIILLRQRVSGAPNFPVKYSITRLAWIIDGRNDIHHRSCPGELLEKRITVLYVTVSCQPVSKNSDYETSQGRRKSLQLVGQEIWRNCWMSSLGVIRLIYPERTGKLTLRVNWIVLVKTASDWLIFNREFYETGFNSGWRQLHAS